MPLPVLDESTGYAAPRALLRKCLPYAPAAFLAGAVQNPSLGLAELLLLLRNRKAPAALLLQIGSDRRWTRMARVKHRLVLHPQAPLALGRGLLRQLYWKELAEVSVAPHVNAVLRRLAAKHLETRLDRATIGERIALARRAPRAIIPVLAESDEARVLEALLANPYLVEADVMKIASGATAPTEVLGRLSVHVRWSGRRSVRLALALNVRTPVATALGVVRKLSRQDLRRLCRDPELPGIVRIGAGRRLEEVATRRAEGLST